MAGMMTRLRTEAGVAMMTVLFIGSVLTVVAGTASFVAIRQLKSDSASQKGSQAIAYAEAGLDRMLSELKKGTFPLTTVMTAGCATPPSSLPAGRVGGGTYSAEIAVYNANATPQVPPSPYNPATNPSSPPCQGRSTSPRTPQTYAVTATGRSGSATRAVRGVVTITGSGLPTGVFVNNMNVNGNPDFTNISVFARGDVFGREKMGFSGDDLFFTKQDVYGSGAGVGQVPAAVHATGAIYLTLNSKRGVEHPPSPNCAANPRGTANQSVWDGSGLGATLTTGCGHPAGYPPTSKFTDADMQRLSGSSTPTRLEESEDLALKAAAQGGGLYCSISTAGGACTKGGQPWTLPPGGVITDAALASGAGVLPPAYVAYFEYTTGSPMSQSITWNASSGAGACEAGRSTVLVVKNGGATFRSNGSLIGDVIAPDGVVDSAGGYTITGTVMARELRLRGTARFNLTPCFIQNPPSPLMNVTTGRWSEVDR